MTGDITELELQAPESEAALLGAAAFHGDAIAGVLAGLPGDDFYDYTRGKVWDACRALSADREPITPVTAAQRMNQDGTWSDAAQRVVSGPMLTPSPASHAPRHAEIVEQFARRRELVRKAIRVRQILTADDDPTELLARARAEFDAQPQPRHGSTGPLGWDALIEEFEQVHAPGTAQPGIPTPWWELDEVLGGLHGGRVYVFGGRPGQGKSTAALCVAMHAAEEGREALVISKEMPSVDVTGRLLARGAEVPLAQIAARRLSDSSRGRIRDYVKRLGRIPLTVDAKPRSLAGIKTLARAHHHRHGLEVLVVDYLQLVRVEQVSRTREQEVAEVSRQLKELALELDTVVVLPAQLNRGSVQRADPRPTMSDLRDSGQIEQDADAVILLHRPLKDADSDNKILFIVDKNRHGATAEISLRWSGGYGQIA